jgi:hypothetical protein
VGACEGWPDGRPDGLLEGWPDGLLVGCPVYGIRYQVYVIQCAVHGMRNIDDMMGHTVYSKQETVCSTRYEVHHSHDKLHSMT